ncbi:alpha/beta hydrolase [Brucella sp. NF 2653]|uniref:alpha/beta hydrolase n=1 Tax=Brucella sp. NF 2653 TaxID=693748 RepID=UPI003D133BED
MSVAAPEFTPEFIDVDGTKIAVRYRAGDKLPGVVWLGGYRSDMLGTKAVILDGWAAQTGHSALRHDYSGHGESGGDFNQGTISRWLAQSLAVYRHYASGPQILVGSSMGGWIALRMAQELKKEGRAPVGIVLIAPAPISLPHLSNPRLPGNRSATLKKRAISRNRRIIRPILTSIPARSSKTGDRIWFSMASSRPAVRSISCKACRTRMFPTNMH